MNPIAPEQAGAGPRRPDPEAMVDMHQDLRQAGNAGGVEGIAPGRKLEIQFGHFCNDRCVFCESGQLSEARIAKPMQADPVIESLERGAEAGIKSVTFLGGEPTIQPGFLAALQRSVELGYEEIIIFTNMARGSSRSWIEKVCAMGDFTWRVSVQGGNREAHEATTQRNTSWKRIVDGLTTLHELDQDITVNVCMQKHSYKSLPDYPELCRRYGVRQMHVDMVRTASVGRRSDEYRRSILPSHAEMKPYMRRMLEGFHELDPDYDVNVGNYAYCMLPEWAHKIHHGGEPTFTLTADKHNRLNTLREKYEHQAWDAVYGVQCGGCVFVDRCRGVPQKYAELIGTEEFEPVTHARLLELDTEQRSFTLLARPWVAPLAETDPPEGWALLDYTEDSRERFIEMRFSHGGASEFAGVTRFRFTPVVNHEAAAPVLITDRYELCAYADAGLPAGALGALVRWAQDVLTAHPEVGERERRAPAASGAGMDPGLVKVLRLAGRLRKAPLGEAWEVRDISAVDGKPEALVRFGRGAGDRLDLRLSAKPGGAGVAAGFELGEGTDKDAAKALVRRVSALLKRAG